MLDLLKEFGMFKYLKFDKDGAFFGKDKITLYFVPQLVAEYFYLKKIFKLDYEVAEFLASKYSGKNFVESHGIPLQKSLLGVVDISCKVLNAFGWGSFKPIKVDENKKFLLIESSLSNFAEELKKRFNPQQNPCDWMLLGLFAGATEHYCGGVIYGVELNCICQKDTKKCAYLCGTEEAIIEYTKKFSLSQLAWVEEVIKKEKEMEQRLK